MDDTKRMTADEMLQHRWTSVSLCSRLQLHYAGLSLVHGPTARGQSFPPSVVRATEMHCAIENGRFRHRPITPPWWRKGPVPKRENSRSYGWIRIWIQQLGYYSVNARFRQTVGSVLPVYAMAEFMMVWRNVMAKND